MRARLVLVPFVFAAALLAGCTTAATPGTAPTTTPPDNGVSALSADEILAKAKTALTAATSFRIKGESTDAGAKTVVDLQLAGKNGKGTIEANGVKFELIKIDNDIYMKASDDFWKTQLKPGQEGALLLLKGKYVKVDATNQQFGGFATTFDVSEILKPEGTVSKGDAATVNDVPTITLIDSKQNAKMYIATRGEPYPLRMEPVPGQGTIDFSDFNGSADIKAPSADQVFDLKALLGG